MTMIDRRTLLGASGAALLLARTGLAGAQVVGESRQVVVIGGGIIGAVIAYHLAKSGAKVTVLEKEKPAAGATEKSFAWLNAGSKRPRPYHMLNLLGIMGWHRLQAELGTDVLPMQWGGCVDWTAGEDAAKMREAIARQQAWGYPVRAIGAAEITRLLPGVTPGPVDFASFAEAEGTVDPVLATRVLFDAAKRYGAKIEFPVSVTGFDQAGGQVKRVLTDKGPIACDNVALAAGLACEPLAAMLGAKVPVITSTGVLAHTEVKPMALPRLAFGPGANIKQNPEGSFVTGSSFGGTPDVKATRETGEALLAFARKYVPAIGEAKLSDVTLGHRVLPKDSYPIVGALPSCGNVYVAAMHSGMSQGPLIGQLAAVEILGGPKADLLDTFRPDRFA
ncbi:hypothetical protein L288_17135 [Sphingobium quisquiliarum P25]|uniref:FAD dependent oxidoreductase domain-containing protein n=1 Tax=Sphingobium quisquiliarum P25 TaxID=1329909 RepID=T0HRK6_9SPHN|nr:FAD-dependent oxidoreductase [Sphingobium quisquiliarum]EQB01945.1 hypothetical protein L288_17135 [Sphingobium quisquiliarum P25]